MSRQLVESANAAIQALGEALVQALKDKAELETSTVEAVRAAIWNCRAPGAAGCPLPKRRRSAKPEDQEALPL